MPSHASFSSTLSRSPITVKYKKAFQGLQKAQRLRGWHALPLPSPGERPQHLSPCVGGILSPSPPHSLGWGGRRCSGQLGRAGVSSVGAPHSRARPPQALALGTRGVPGSRAHRPRGPRHAPPWTPLARCRGARGWERAWLSLIYGSAENRSAPAARAPIVAVAAAAAAAAEAAATATSRVSGGRGASVPAARGRGGGRRPGLVCRSRPLTAAGSWASPPRPAGTRARTYWLWRPGAGTPWGGGGESWEPRGRVAAYLPSSGRGN